MNKKFYKKCLTMLIISIISISSSPLVGGITSKIYNSNFELKIALSNIITVDDDGGEDYTSIQQAIDNATSGDSILVYSGLYKETVTLNKQFILNGVEENEEGMPVIDAESREYGVSIEADGCIFQNFKVINTSKMDFIYAGIIIYSDNNVLTNNTISNNVNGFWLENSNGNIIFNNILTNSMGFFLLESSNNTIDNNQINSTWCETSKPGGITLWYNCKNNTINENIIECDYNGFGILLSESTNNKITNNKISSYTTSPYANRSSLFKYGAYGIVFQLYSHDNKLIGNNISYYLSGMQLLSSNKNLLSKNNFTKSGVMGLYLAEADRNIISKNNFINNSFAIEDMLSPIPDGSLKKLILKILKQHASFANSYLNSWNGNFWDDWSGFGPKAIRGIVLRKHFSIISTDDKVHGLPYILMQKFDWRPNKTPFDASQDQFKDIRYNSFFSINLFNKYFYKEDEIKNNLIVDIFDRQEFSKIQYYLPLLTLITNE